MKRLLASVMAVAGLTAAGAARADVNVYAGYYDLGPCCGNPNSLPDPWAGSPNTAFIGDISYALSSDPDEGAILLTNTGPLAVTLNPGFSVGPLSVWDGYIGSGFNIAAGHSVIISGSIGDEMDGSEHGLGGSNVTLSINGGTHVFSDLGVLGGFPSYDETIPWTQIGTVHFTTDHGPPVVDGGGAPEPAGWALMIAGFGLAGTALRRRSAPSRA